MVEGQADSLPNHAHIWKLGPSENSWSDAKCDGCGTDRSFPTSYDELRRITLKKSGFAERKKFNTGSHLQSSLTKRFAAIDALDGNSWEENSSRGALGTSRYAPIDDSYD